MTMFAIIELAAAVATYNSISYAAREAARFAIANGPNSPNPASTAAIQQVAQNALVGVNLSTPGPTPTISVTWSPDPNLSPLQDVTVTVSYPYTLTLPFIKTSTFTITSTSQMLSYQ